MLLRLAARAGRSHHLNISKLLFMDLEGPWIVLWTRPDPGTGPISGPALPGSAGTVTGGYTTRGERIFASPGQLRAPVAYISKIIFFPMLLISGLVCYLATRE